jgi:hypothetical protein
MSTYVRIPDDSGGGGGGAVDSVFGRTGVVVALSGDYDAVQVDFTPDGDIVATDTQAAIVEVRDDTDTKLALKEDAANKGVANGYASLDGTGRVPSSQLSVTAIEYLGTWDASTNTPTLTSGVGTQGDFYYVSVAGSTNLDGITDWQVGDTAIFSGSVWQKLDNTDSVVSVNTQTGVVVLDTDDIAEGGSNLYYTEGRVSANASVVANTAKVSADGSVTTHSDVSSAGSGAIITNAERTLVGTAVQPGDNVSGLTNDAGYITNPVTADLDLGDNDILDVNAINFSNAAGSDVQFTRDSAAAGVPAYTFVDAGNGQWEWEDGALNSTFATGFRLTNDQASTFIEVDAFEVVLQGNPITLRENGGSSILDVGLRMRNNSGNFSGRVTFDADTYWYANSTDQTCYSRRDNAASANAFTFDTDNTFNLAGQNIIRVENGGTKVLGINKNGGLQLVPTSTAVDVNTNGETVILVTDTSVARTITLDSDDVVAGQIVIIKDASGGAGTNNITIDTEGAETIDGDPDVDITVNYGAARLVSDGSNWFMI